MKKYFTPITIATIALGVIGGWAYYYFVGCSTGSCPLKSNPWTMMGYGGLIGYLAGDVVTWIWDKLKRKS